MEGGSGADVSPKKMKLSEEERGCGDGSEEPEGVVSFGSFQIDETLNENSQRKMMCVRGHFASTPGKTAVVLMEKSPFSLRSVEGILSIDTHLTQTLHNDIYSTYDLNPKPEFNGIKTTVIYPATDKHIAKYSAQQMYLVQETAQDYVEITKPYIESSNFSIQWVYNILEKKKEADRIVFENPDPEDGFILLPDMKWDRKQLEDLYLVAIVHRHDLLSLRSLTAEHLPLLRNMLQQGQMAIQEKFGVPPSRLRIYFHYQPSYYHLHVHFTHLKYDAPGSGVEKAHLLSDVVDNIELCSDYYQKKTLSFAVKENDGLCKKFLERGQL